jgi:hypothetical protein
MSPSGYRE